MVASLSRAQGTAMVRELVDNSYTSVEILVEEDAQALMALPRISALASGAKLLLSIKLRDLKVWRLSIWHVCIMACEHVIAGYCCCGLKRHSRSHAPCACVNFDCACTGRACAALLASRRRAVYAAPSSSSASRRPGYGAAAAPAVPLMPCTCHSPCSSSLPCV